MINIVKPLAEEFMSHCQNKYGFAHPPKINFVDDMENAKDPMGRTAHYDPQNKSITLYITNRHPKDILRSLAHELTHHLQNLRGEFDEVGELGEGYAQNNEHMRKMEVEAYASGIDVRDWEDSKNNIQKENISMNNKEIALLRKLVEQQVRKTLDAVQKEGIGQHSAKSIGKIPGNYSDDSKPEGDDDEFSDIDPTIDTEYLASQPMGRDWGLEAAIRRNMKRASLKKENIEEDNSDEGSEIGEAHRRARSIDEEDDLMEGAKIKTPEQAQTLYEARFTNRDTKLFEKLLNKWAK